MRLPPIDPKMIIKDLLAISLIAYWEIKKRIYN